MKRPSADFATARVKSERFWVVVVFLLVVGFEPGSVWSTSGRRDGSSGSVSALQLDPLNFADVQCGEQVFLTSRKKRSSSSSASSGSSPRRHSTLDDYDDVGSSPPEPHYYSGRVGHQEGTWAGSPTASAPSETSGSSRAEGRRRRQKNTGERDHPRHLRRQRRRRQRSAIVYQIFTRPSFGNGAAGGSGGGYHRPPPPPSSVTAMAGNVPRRRLFSRLFSTSGLFGNILRNLFGFNRRTTGGDERRPSSSSPPPAPVVAQRISVLGDRRNSTAHVIDASDALPPYAASVLFPPFPLPSSSSAAAAALGGVGNVTQLAMVIRDVLNSRRPQMALDTDAIKIVGGQDSERGEFPFMVSLKRGSSNFCGGSIVNRRYVVTAAHCVVPTSTRDLVVVAGEHDITKRGDELEYPVENIIVHPDYADIPGLSNPNDIALLRLARDLEWSPFVQPICLPSNSNAQLGRMDATVIGWGRIREGGPQSSVLRQVTLPILPRFLCYVLYFRFGFSSNHLCAGGRIRGGRDACHGDSGGPLVVREQGRFILAGIVSGGKGCGRPLTSGIYMNTARYLKWIHTAMFNDHVIANYLK